MDHEHDFTKPPLLGSLECSAVSKSTANEWMRAATLRFRELQQRNDRLRIENEKLKTQVVELSDRVERQHEQLREGPLWPAAEARVKRQMASESLDDLVSDSVSGET